MPAPSLHAALVFSLLAPATGRAPDDATQAATPPPTASALAETVEDPPGELPVAGTAADDDTGARADAAADVETSVVPLPAPDPTVTATEPPRPVVSAEPVDDGRRTDIVSRSLLGGGIGALVVSAGLVGVSSWAWFEASEETRALDQGLSGADSAQARDRRAQMRVVGVATAAGAAAYGITGIVLLALRQRDRRARRAGVTARTFGSVGGFGVRF